MNVKSVMTSEPKSCRPGESLARAAQIMWDGDCGCVPVVDDKGEVVGMVTDRDVCMAAYTQSRPLSEIPVSTAMSRQVFGCGPEDSLEAAEEIMRRHQVRRLPVLGFEGQLLGLLSLNDLARAVADQKMQRGPGMTPVAIESTLAAVCRPRQVSDAAGALVSA